MKRKLLTIALLAPMMTTSAFAVEGEHSTVNFTGNIVVPTCALTSESHDQVVDIGTVSTNVFTGKGSAAAEHKFSIGVENCTDSTHTRQYVLLRFTGDSDDGLMLKTTNSDVGIRLFDVFVKRPVPLDGSDNAWDITIGNDAYYFEYTAKYVALSDKVTPGEANAMVNFLIDYL